MAPKRTALRLLGGRTSDLPWVRHRQLERAHKTAKYAKHDTAISGTPKTKDSGPSATRGYQTAQPRVPQNMTS